MSYPVAFTNSLLVTVVALAVLTIFPAMLGYYLGRLESQDNQSSAVQLFVQYAQQSNPRSFYLG